MNRKINELKVLKVSDKSKISPKGIPGSKHTSRMDLGR